MIYLAIVVIVAGAGILRLWLQQRRQRVKVDDIVGFKSSLERLSEPGRSPAPLTARLSSTSPHEPSTPAPPPGVAPLDERRRRAAKNRIEARRRSARAV